MDRQTDRFAISISRVSMLTRDKNNKQPSERTIRIIIHMCCGRDVLRGMIQESFCWFFYECDKQTGRQTEFPWHIRRAAIAQRDNCFLLLQVFMWKINCSFCKRSYIDGHLLLPHDHVIGERYVLVMFIFIFLGSEISDTVISSNLYMIVTLFDVEYLINGIR